MQRYLTSFFSEAQFNGITVISQNAIETSVELRTAASGAGVNMPKTAALTTRIPYGTDGAINGYSSHLSVQYMAKSSHANMAIIVIISSIVCISF